MPQPSSLGLDVACDHLDLAVHPTWEAWRIPNPPADFNYLVRRVLALQPTRIVPEASGGHGQEVDAALSRPGCR